MVKRRIIWSEQAAIELKEVLEFYKDRNQSSDYSKKLYHRIRLELEIVSKRPEIGIKTKLGNIRGLIIGDYIVFYEIHSKEIRVLELWDARQDPGKIRTK